MMVCAFLFLFLSFIFSVSFDVVLQDTFYMQTSIWVFQVGHEQEDMDINTKMQKLLYLLYKTLPLLRHIQREQSSELDVEATIQGIAL